MRFGFFPWGGRRRRSGTVTPPAPVFQPGSSRAAMYCRKMLAFQPCKCRCTIFDQGVESPEFLDYCNVLSGSWSKTPLLDSVVPGATSCAYTESSQGLLLLGKRTAGDYAVCIAWNVTDSDNAIVRTPLADPPQIYMIFNWKDASNYWYVVTQQRPVTAHSTTIQSAARLGYVQNGTNHDVTLFLCGTDALGQDTPYAGVYAVCFQESLMSVADDWGDVEAYNNLIEPYGSQVLRNTIYIPLVRDNTDVWIGVAENAGGHRVHTAAVYHRVIGNTNCGCTVCDGCAIPCAVCGTSTPDSYQMDITGGGCGLAGSYVMERTQTCFGFPFYGCQFVTPSLLASGISSGGEIQYEDSSDIGGFLTVTDVSRVSVFTNRSTGKNASMDFASGGSVDCATLDADATSITGTCASLPSGAHVEAVL
jgi:hypothetical protein